MSTLRARCMLRLPIVIPGPLQVAMDHCSRVESLPRLLGNSGDCDGSQHGQAMMVASDLSVRMIVAQEWATPEDARISSPSRWLLHV